MRGRQKAAVAERLWQRLPFAFVMVFVGVGTPLVFGTCGTSATGAIDRFMRFYPHAQRDLVVPWDQSGEVWHVNYCSFDRTQGYGVVETLFTGCGGDDRERGEFDISALQGDSFDMPMSGLQRCAEIVLPPRPN